MENGTQMSQFRLRDRVTPKCALGIAQIEVVDRGIRGNGQSIVLVRMPLDGMEAINVDRRCNA
jgi:hypothetical protein